MPGPVERHTRRFVQRRLFPVTPVTGGSPLGLARSRVASPFAAQLANLNGWTYLLVVLTIFGGARLRDSNALLILGGMLSGPLLLSYWLPRRALARLDVQRQIPAGIAATDRLVVELTVTNRLRWLSTWGVEIEDVCRYEGPLTGVDTGPGRVLFPYLAPRASCRAVYEGSPPVRGRYLFGPLRLTTFFPLGLVRHRRWINLPAESLVWPRLGRLTTSGVRLARQSELVSQRTRRRPTRSELDFHGLRDWRPGDSRRWIHWRSTARRGQIVVRQFDVARGHDVALFVDLWQPPRGRRSRGGPAVGERVGRNRPVVGRHAGDRYLPSRRLPAVVGGRRARSRFGSTAGRRPAWLAQALSATGRCPAAFAAAAACRPNLSTPFRRRLRCAPCCWSPRARSSWPIFRPVEILRCRRSPWRASNRSRLARRRWPTISGSSEPPASWPRGPTTTSSTAARPTADSRAPEHRASDCRPADRAIATEARSASRREANESRRSGWPPPPRPDRPPPGRAAGRSAPPRPTPTAGW